MHEIDASLYLGPPKTAGSARTVHLPPFLIGLLHEVLDSHDHDQVFVGARGGFLRRSAMSRRVFGPTVNGDPATHTGPVIEGMHFHDLRHTHKTWLIEDGIPEIVQAKRLGHLPPGVSGIYSHVTPAMTRHLLTVLQERRQHTQPPAPAAIRHLRAA